MGLSGLQNNGHLARWDKVSEKSEKFAKQILKPFI
jgi:hypothetical protein